MHQLHQLPGTTLPSGYRGLSAPWIGGIAAPQKQRGYRGLLGFWVGGLNSTKAVENHITPGYFNVHWSQGKSRKTFELKELGLDLEITEVIEKIAAKDLTPADEKKELKNRLDVIKPEYLEWLKIYREYLVELEIMHLYALEEQEAIALLMLFL